MVPAALCELLVGVVEDVLCLVSRVVDGFFMSPGSTASAPFGMPKSKMVPRRDWPALLVTVASLPSESVVVVPTCMFG
jgi:hypothetical protein